MIIGTPKELKPNETRVGITPRWAKILTRDGHQVMIEKNAGFESGFEDEEYSNAGAKIAGSIEEIYAKSDFVAKVKELMVPEYTLMKEGQLVMAWFHLAEDFNQDMTNALLNTGATALSMELITLPDGTRPTIKPMSEIAGSLAMLEAVKYSQRINGGNGLLLRRIPGLPAPSVVILGGGHAGLNAAEVAVGLGLKTTILEGSWEKITHINEYLPEVQTVYREKELMEQLICECDVLINCLYPPADHNRKPLISREAVKKMKKGSLIMDVSGANIIETCHYTTLSDPVYHEEGILHYCVDNMPALCPKTATEALLMISGPYIQNIADNGLAKAAEGSQPLMHCISTYRGKIVHPEIAKNQDMPYEALTTEMLL